MLLLCMPSLGKMSEFRSLIRQFDEMAHKDDKRRLKLEQMCLGIKKTEAEIEKLAGNESQQKTASDL